MKKNFFTDYKENLADFKTLMMAQKMPENRADGTETEKERKELCYSLSEVEFEKKHLEQLLSGIKKEGWDSKVKTFIIGCCEDRPGIFYLMDGQHGRAIVKILIEEGILPPDTKFKYTINFYKTYEEMVHALMYINNGKPMKFEQMSRAKTFSNGECGENYKAFMALEEKYHNQVRDSLIRICMFGQNNGSTVYSKHINEFAEQLVKCYINLADNARKIGATSEFMGVVTGVQHGMIALRDLYNIIFTAIFSNSPSDAKKEDLIFYGMELCDTFNKALLGQFTPPSKGYTLTTVQALLGYNGSNLKREIRRYINNDVIRFYKYKSEMAKMNSDFIIDCIDEWADLSSGRKKK